MEAKLGDTVDFVTDWGIEREGVIVNVMENGYMIQFGVIKRTIFVPKNKVTAIVKPAS